MKKKIVVVIGLNTLAFNDRRFNEDWLRYRIGIFMKYTRKTIENQTYQDFLTVVVYEPESEQIINNILKEYSNLPKNIIFTKNSSIPINDYIKDGDEVLAVRLDSDDMYHPTYFERLINYNHKEGTQAIISQDGYAYDTSSNRLTTYHHQSPPFYALVYSVKDFMSGVRYRVEGGHVGIINLKYEIIKGDNFCVILHGKNNGTNFYIASKFGKEIVNQKHMKSVLQQFNIDK